MNPKQPLWEEELEIFAAVDTHLTSWKKHTSKEMLLYHTKLAQDFSARKTKNKQITIRLSERDIVALKALAKQKWIPYQTYLTTMIHERIAAQ